MSDAVVPPPAFRVGITGHRDLSAALEPALREALRELLATIRDALIAAGADEAHRSGGRPRLRVVSAMAAGADLWLAEVAREMARDAEAAGCDIAIEAILPFERAACRQDLDDENGRRFDRVLDEPPWPGSTVRPWILALDGAHGDDDDRLRQQAYRAAGRMVMRNCDLMIAIWDPARESRPGGTGELVEFTARHGPPLWWLNPLTPTVPVVIEDLVQLRQVELAEAASPTSPITDPRTWLAAMLATALHPPRQTFRHPHGLIERAVSVVVRSLAGRGGGGPYEDLRRERQLPDHPLAGLYSRCHALAVQPSTPLHGLARLALALLILEALLGASGLHPAIPLTAAGALLLLQLLLASPVRTPERNGESYWARAHALPDQLSVAYADRYRSAYVAVIALAALAIALAVFGLADRSIKTAVTVAELVTLTAIVSVVARSFRKRWHERWLGYRLLAEMCRKQRFLAMLGWRLPLPMQRHRDHRDDDPQAWVAWHFDALLRAAPLPGNAIGTAPALGSIRHHVLNELVRSQIAYHESRQRSGAAAAARWSSWGELAFIATVGLVIAKLAWLAVDDHAVQIARLGAAAAILPALSAAFFALRAYSEEQLLSDQSEHMIAVLREAEANLAAMALARPLSSQALAAEIYELAIEMLRDIEGWSRLIRVKILEAG